MKKTTAIIVAFLTISFSSIAQTALNTVLGTQTITKANSPYIISGGTLIPSDAIVTIEPGVVIYFDDDKDLSVEGQLVAKGTNTDTIKFLKVSSYTSFSISFNQNAVSYNTQSNTGCILDYTRMEGKVNIDGCSPQVSNSEITGRAAELSITNSNALISNNKIHDITYSDGIFLIFNDLTHFVIFKNNEIFNCNPNIGWRIFGIACLKAITFTTIRIWE